MSTNTFPTARDIFQRFDFIDRSTDEYKKLSSRLYEKLKKKFRNFEELNEFETLINDSCIEAQTMGFEQGFQFAVKLLVTGGVQ